MSIDAVNCAMREGRKYCASELADQLEISKSYAGQCLRQLWKGGICEREKEVIGKTKAGKDKSIFFYKTRQKDLPI